MNDQERIELFKSLLGAVINVLDLPESEINELKKPPHELVKMVLEEKNREIELLQETLNGINRLSKIKFCSKIFSKPKKWSKKK